MKDQLFHLCLQTCSCTVDTVTHLVVSFLHVFEPYRNVTKFSSSCSIFCDGDQFFPRSAKVFRNLERLRTASQQALFWFLEKRLCIVISTISKYTYQCHFFSKSLKSMFPKHKILWFRSVLRSTNTQCASSKIKTVETMLMSASPEWLLIITLSVSLVARAWAQCRITFVSASS